MSQPQLLVESFRSVLKPAGFRQRADNWFLSNDDTIVVVNLQKSSYSKKYYVNLGVWLKALGDIDLPKEHKCHIRCRLTALAPGEAARIEQLFDFEDESFVDAVRSHEIAALLTDYVTPFVEKVKMIRTLTSFFHSDRWPKACLVHVKAREVLAMTRK